MTARKRMFDFHDMETYFDNWLAGETNPSKESPADESVDDSRAMEKRLDSILFALHAKEKALRLKPQGAK